jgi:hypothetical protein
LNRGAFCGRYEGDIASFVVRAGNEFGSITSESKATPLLKTAPAPPAPVTTTFAASRQETSTTKSSPITIQVHPRLGLGVSGNNFSAKITARDTVAGAVALFQVRTAAGGWRTRQLVVTNLRSVARFHVNLRRGKTYFVRIYLPQRQAGAVYLDGTSHMRCVGGAS